MTKFKWDLRKIKKVKATDNFELICTFDNGIVKQFDLKPLLKRKGSMVEPIKKISFFKRVFLEAGAPTWPNGFDLCPDSIFLKADEIKRSRNRVA